MFDVDSLPDTTLAWLAAMIDGEGSIMMIKRPSRNVAGVPGYRIKVVVYNTDVRLMEVLKEKTGIDRVYTHTRRAKENHKKTSYGWTVVANECRLLIPKLLPWLVCKKEQAECLIQAMNIKDMLIPHDGQVCVPSGEAIPLLDEQEKLYLEIRRLNTKGREHNVE